MPVPPGPGPHTAAQRAGPWHAALHAHQGRVRPRIEDAWAVVPDVRLDEGHLHVFAVFDGLGGVPNGQEAAWAVADGLAAAVQTCGRLERLLPALNTLAQSAVGSTTAAVLALSDDRRRGWVASIGDSSVHRLTPHGTERLNPHDRISRHMLADWLGRGGARGHLRTFDVSPHDRFLLCTDGVDEVVGPPRLAAALAGDATRVAERLAALYADVEAAGAPDNATALAVWS